MPQKQDSVKKRYFDNYRWNKNILRWKYEICQKICFTIKSQEIYSNFETTINDQLGNVYNIEKKFKFDLLNNVISSKKLSVIDDKNNIYYFENSKVDLNNKEIAEDILKLILETTILEIQKMILCLKESLQLSQRTRQKFISQYFQHVTLKINHVLAGK